MSNPAKLIRSERSIDQQVVIQVKFTVGFIELDCILSWVTEWLNEVMSDARKYSRFYFSHISNLRVITQDVLVTNN